MQPQKSKISSMLAAALPFLFSLISHDSSAWLNFMSLPARLRTRKPILIGRKQWRTLYLNIKIQETISLVMRLTLRKEPDKSTRQALVNPLT